MNDLSYLNMGMVSLDWHNRNAADYVAKVMNKYGPPSAVDPQVGGMAIWKKNKLLNTPYERIEIVDEAVPSCKPVKHSGFVNVYINLAVAPSRFLEVTSVSGNLVYDPMKKLLKARSGTIEGCIALLALASQVAEAHMSLNYVQANDLVTQWVLSTNNPDKVSRMFDLLSYNIKHSKGSPYPQGFWELSNPEGCS